MRNAVFSKIRNCWDSHERVLLPVLLGTLYFLIQLTQINQYGVTWDEPLHRNWGKLFVLFWQSGDRNYLELMPGNGIEYGPLYYAANYLLSEFLYTKVHLFRFVAANHLLNLFTASVAVGMTFALARNLGGKRIAWYACMFFVFFPLFIAHSHYNPKDIPLLASILFTSFVFLSALRTGRRATFILSGFLMGMSIATKVSALLMAPVFAFSYALWLVRSYKTASSGFIRSQCVMAICSLAALAFGIFLFWPSAWGDWSLIVASVRFFLRNDFWPGKELFMGTEYLGAALPWFYTPFTYIAVTPVLTVLSLVCGLVLLVRRLRRNDDLARGFFLLSWLLFPILFSLKPGLVRYDGMRQFFFVLPAVVVIAAMGFDRILTFIRPRVRVPHAVMICIGLTLLSLIHEIAIMHPYEGAYRNEVIRMVYPKNMDRHFAIEYWGSTYREGMQWLIDNAEPNPVICVPTAEILVAWYPWRNDFTFDCSPETNYIMFFTRYTELTEDQIPPKDQKVFSIRRMNAELLKIFKID